MWFRTTFRVRMTSLRVSGGCVWVCHTQKKLKHAFYHWLWGGPNCFYAWEIHKNRKMNLNVQELWQIYLHLYNISDHLISTANVSNKSEMYSPSHFGPKRSPDTFRLEHSLVRNWPLNVENLWHVIKITSKTSFLGRFLKILKIQRSISDQGML